jgi:pimeloyl-ACP methyl ester carboxylesterase
MVRFTLTVGRLLSTALALLVLSCGHVQAGEESSADGLAALVWQYVNNEDGDQAGSQLAAILQRPDATLERLGEILRQGPPYGLQPVGTFTDQRVTVRGQPYQYSLYVPQSYDPTSAYPLVICLHGAGFTGEAYLDRWQQRLGERYILVCPTYPAGAWFTRRAEELVLTVQHAVRQRYRIDPDRIFLTGMSNGGIGTWLIGMHHAPLFAGLAPMASGIDDVLFPFLENLRSTPTYIIHGRQDQVMPVELSRKLSSELKNLGYPFVYREHDRTHPMAGGHFFPREELPELIGWFDNQRRTATPKVLTVVRDASHFLPFNWVRIDATDAIASFSDDLVDKRDEAIRQRSYAHLTARVAEPNRIELQSDHVRQLTLFLNDELIDVTKPVIAVVNGQVSELGRLTPSAEVLLKQARLRQDPRRLFSIQLSIPVPPPAS